MAGETGLYKLMISSVLGFIAAMVIILTGLIADVRLTTILLRGMAGFLVTGLGALLLTFILEEQNIIGFDKNIELMENLKDDAIKSPDELEAMAKQDRDEASNGENDIEKEQENVENTGFTPLNSDNLKRMEPPPAT